MPIRRQSSSAVIPISAMLALTGGVLQGYANGTTHAVIASMIFLVLGYLAVRLIFPHGKAEHRAYLLTYGIGVFVGGLAQCYSTAAFGEVQSFVDANTFFSVLFDRPPYYTWDDLENLWLDGKPAGGGAPLAVLLWQWGYHIRLLMGLDFGIYFGVMMNAVVMGGAAAITVRTARELFGDDAWRLRRVGTLFALCGLFILFGAILIRDCFTTFVNSLVLWGIVRWLVNPTSSSAMRAGLLTAVSAAAMMYLRSRTVVMFGVFWMLGAACWFLKQRFDFRRGLALVSAVLVLLYGSTYILSYFQVSIELQSKHMDQYVGVMERDAQEDSLGMRLVVNQPLPVRLIAGTGYLMIFPVPLWAGIKSGSGEYHLIKAYHAFYQLFTLPLVLAGFIAVYRKWARGGAHSMAMVFLTLYLAVNVLAVVATSLEQRHVAQFMPAFMILAAVPDTRIRAEWNRVCGIAFGWYVLLVVIHLAWAIAVFGR
ncbi:MAG: hypothetical protein JNK74_15345 [Candidatus Hydrogenedentes bacterium]|nr:hypothetical protein [Candidatus Hydrogenedentota bacterium]